MLKDQENVERLMVAIKEMIMKMQEVDDTCAKLSADLSKKELSLIAFVGDKEAVIMREIAEYLQVPMSTTTGIVDKMVGKGYLERQHSAKDRRTICIALTEYGNQAHQLLSNMRLTMTKRIISNLEEKEVNNLIGLLEKVTRNLHKHVPGPS